MKILVTLLPLLFIYVSFGKEHDKHPRKAEYLYWDEHKLNWEDFQGNIPSSTEYIAMTSSAIDFELHGENNTLYVTISTVFSSKDSWKKQGVDDYILSHEQLHFDITELFARKLRKELQSTSLSNPSTISDKCNQLYDKFIRKWKAFQNKYDKQTAHSIKQEQQTKWSKKVKSLLNDYSSYKKRSFTLKIG